MDSLHLLSHVLFSILIAGFASMVTLLLVRHFRAYDIPNERSSHTQITPRGGGIAIVTAFIAGILLIHLFGDKSPIYTRHFLGFLTGSFVIAAFSLFDDIRHVSARIKFSGYSLAIVVTMLSGIVIDVTYLPWIGEVRWGWLAFPLTFLWIFGLTNAYNFIDGLDGLAASTAVIAAGFFAFISFTQGSHFIYLASLSLSAAALGFLMFNWPPARIFMGDVGSTFIGFTFAVMAVIAARYDHSHTSFFVVPLLLFHFIFDAFFTFVRRILAGENVLAPHRSHLYQLLNRLGYPHKKVTLLYSAMAICQGFLAVWMLSIQGEYRLLAFLPVMFFQSVYAAWVLFKAKKCGVRL